MDSQRNLLIIALLFVSFCIWEAWEQNKNSQLQSHSTQVTSTITDSSKKNILTKNYGKQITVKTDVLELIINTRGGHIERAVLLDYSKNLESYEPLQLLESTSEFIYQAHSGLIGNDGLDKPYDNVYSIYNVDICDADKNLFELADGQNELIIPMKIIDSRGNIFIKTFGLKRNEYVVDVSYEVHNLDTKPLIVSVFGYLKQSIELPLYRNINNSNFALSAYRGAAYSTADKRYEKYKFSTIANKKNLNIKTKGGWIAMSQQHFATAWIPDHNSINNFYTANINDNIALIGYESQPTSIQPGEIKYLHSKLWVGPAVIDKMAVVAPYLDLIVDYGWLWFISQPLFMLLKFIYSFLGNWGFSIILITFIVRGIMYPLTKAQYTSMAKMCVLQPKIQAIREDFSNDKQRQSQEIIALYKSEKVNPLGGCFPLLIQMPIFLALYYMLIASVELRHAPFILWIHDLSSQDPYYVLPILMGITMFFIQKLSPNTKIDPMQQKIMLCMLVVFTLFFLWFPSGLVLYYIISNLVTIIQQKLISRNLKKK